MLFLSLLVSASLATDLSQSLTLKTIEKPLINEVISIKPIKDHHFNLEAPQDCGKNGSIQASAKSIKCQFHASGSQTSLVSICDNEKKYCKQERIKFNVQKASSKTPRIQQKGRPETAKIQKALKAKLMQGFLETSPKKALKKLTNKKGALAMVSTDWCPPCNLSKEFLLNKKEFKNLTKDYLLLYVDGDAPSRKAWKPYLKAYYYPSFILLNKNLEIVSTKTGYSYTPDFTAWFKDSEKHLQDPITSVQKRIKTRLSGSFKQKFNDFFTSEESKSLDLKRLIDHLQAREENKKIIDYIAKLSPQKLKKESLESQYRRIWFGDLSQDFEKEDKEKQLQDIATQLSELKPSKDDMAYFYLNANHCKTKKLAESICNKIKLKTDSLNDKNQKELWPKLAADEKLIFETSKLLEQAQNLEQEQKIKEANKVKDICTQKLDELTQLSPLKEKSRAVRMRKIYCFNSTKTAQNLELIKQLAKDYPFESTFHHKLAKQHLQQKDFNKALASIEEALNYGYGSSWAKAVLTKVKILRAMSKDQKAFEFLTSSLKEISLDQKNRKTNWLKSLRQQERELKSKLKI